MIVIIGLMIFLLKDEEIISEDENIQATLYKYFKRSKTNGQKNNE